MIRRARGAGDPLVLIARAAAQDAQLSYRARGILLAVMSRPDDWRTDIDALARGGREGEHAIATALRELEARGYLRRTARQRPAGDPDGLGGTWFTEWDLTDDPALLGPPLPKRSPTGPRKPRPGAPRPGAPQPGAPRAGKPRALLERETDEETPPPTPAADATVVGALGGVVARIRKGNGVGAPSERTLHAELERLAVLGWDAETLERVMRAHDWHGIRAGGVIAWLRDQAEPPASGARTAGERSAWCGACDEPTRFVEGADGRMRRCPDCHPAATGLAS